MSEPGKLPHQCNWCHGQATTWSLFTGYCCDNPGCVKLYQKLSRHVKDSMYNTLEKLNDKGKVKNTH